MTTYAIGDIHGCAESLRMLLKRLPADSKFLFIGDVINRGPESLNTLRLLRDMGDRVSCVLGNHDLHMLAVYAGHREMSKKDSIAEILDAPDADELINWVRHWSMAKEVNGVLAVHAAVHWSWTAKDTIKYASEVENCLRGDRWQTEIGELFGKTQWKPKMDGLKRLRAIVNVLTRTRYLTEDGEMDFDAKLSPEVTENGLVPWFQFPHRQTKDTPIVFGHWSTLGLVKYPKIYPLDTACIWGGSLTARPLNKLSEVIQVKAPKYLAPW